MADLNYRTGSQTGVGARVIDEGLRAYMLRVYNLMALGVAVTALVALFLANNQALMLTIASGPMMWVLFFAILGLGFFAPRLIFSGNSALAHAAYWGYAVLWGLIISPMIARYMGIDGGSLIVQALGITAVTFGATSLAGYVTKRDLSGFGGFFMMASIGLVLAIIANAIFFQSVGMSLVVSILVVLLFSAVTAWETQRIKEMYVEGDAVGIAQGKAIFGAFMLYGSFVTMFVHILNILGIMRSSD
ncbi:MAG: Bax inhibitor-1 family protein [Parvibaculaceae bacterium]